MPQFGIRLLHGVHPIHAFPVRADRMRQPFQPTPDRGEIPRQVAQVRGAGLLRAAPGRRVGFTRGAPGAGELGVETVRGVRRLVDRAFDDAGGEDRRPTVLVEAADAGTVERMKGVVARHLDRFAFREAPLRFDWTEG